jgi:hypothetical protein
MTVSELIVALAVLPGELEVVFDHTQEGDPGFRLEVVTTLDEIKTDTGKRLIIINHDLIGE